MALGKAVDAEHSTVAAAMGLQKDAGIRPSSSQTGRCISCGLDMVVIGEGCQSGRTIGWALYLMDTASLPAIAA